MHTLSVLALLAVTQLSAMRVRPVSTLSALNAHGGMGSTIISRPLGVASGDIPDERFTASSTYRAEFSIFNPWLGRAFSRRSDPSQGYWRPAQSAAGEFLEIDLGRDFLITGVATQGAFDDSGWVSRYQLQFSRDGVMWKQYALAGPNGFVANSDGNTVVINDLHERVSARYVRFVVVTWGGEKGAAMRAEVYGFTAECEANEDERLVAVPCAKSATAIAATRMGEGEGEANVIQASPERKWARGFPIGMEAGLIADGQITASSTYEEPSTIRVDPVCDAILHGGRVGVNATTPIPYKGPFGAPKIAPDAVAASIAAAVATKASSESGAKAGASTTSSSSSSSSIPTDPTKGKHRFSSSTAAGAAELDTEQPAGQISITSNGLPDCLVRMRYSPGFARLNAMPQPAKSGGWKAGNDMAGEYLQVDLGSLQEVDAVATQGRQDSEDWVTGFTLQYSVTGATWSDLPTLFTANSDSRTLVKNVLAAPLLTRYIRFVVKSFHQTDIAGNSISETSGTPMRGGIGLRVEVYGPGKGQGCMLRCHAARLMVQSKVADIEAELANANAAGAILVELEKRAEGGEGALKSSAGAETSSGVSVTVTAEGKALALVSKEIGMDARSVVDCCGCPCCSSIRPNTCRKGGGAQDFVNGGYSVVESVGRGLAVPLGGGPAGTVPALGGGLNLISGSMGGGRGGVASSINSPIAVTDGGRTQVAWAPDDNPTATAVAATARLLLRGGTPGGGEGPVYAGNGNARNAVAAVDQQLAAAFTIANAQQGTSKTYYVVQRDGRQ